MRTWRQAKLQSIARRILRRMGMEVVQDDGSPPPDSLVLLRPFERGAHMLVTDHQSLLCHRHEPVIALLPPEEVHDLLSEDMSDDAMLDRAIALQEAFRVQPVLVVFDPTQRDALVRLGAAGVHFLSAPALAPDMMPQDREAGDADITVIGHGAAAAPGENTVARVVAALCAVFPELRVDGDPASFATSGLHVHVGFGLPATLRMVDSAARRCPIVMLRALRDMGSAAVSAEDVPIEHETSGLIASSIAAVVTSVAALRADPILFERIRDRAFDVAQRHDAGFAAALGRLLAPDGPQTPARADAAALA
jgi:hypothetical protein